EPLRRHPHRSDRGAGRLDRHAALRLARRRGRAGLVRARARLRAGHRRQGARESVRSDRKHRAAAAPLAASGGGGGRRRSRLRRLAERVKEGIRSAGATPMEFNTIAISDGVTMGTEGMKASLVSREVIADSIELVGRGHLFDAMVTLVACDKTIPGGAMALLRL